MREEGENGGVGEDDREGLFPCPLTIPLDLHYPILHLPL
jgi:hypothetical protein